MNIKQVKSVLPTLFQTGLTPMIIGQHGIGKSQVVRQVAESLGMGFVDVRVGEMSDPGDLMGLPEIADSAHGRVTNFVKPDWFPREKNTLVFIDEINRAPKLLQQPLFRLILDKQLGQNKLPEGCVVIAACNPPGEDDYIVTEFEDKAYKSRFCMIYLEPTVQEWLSYGEEKGFNRDVLGFVAEHPEMLEESKVVVRTKKVPDRRSWEFVNKLTQISSYSNIDVSLQFEVISGIVGSESATSFHSYINDKTKGLDPDQILNKYPSIKKKVVELAKSRRTDILAVAMQRLQDNWKTLSRRENGVYHEETGLNVITLEMQEKDPNCTRFLTDEQMDNLADFIKDLPKDLALTFIDGNFMYPAFTDSMHDHKALCAYAKST